jgi:hypothetical protein
MDRQPFARQAPASEKRLHALHHGGDACLGSAERFRMDETLRNTATANSAHCDMLSDERRRATTSGCIADGLVVATLRRQAMYTRRDIGSKRDMGGIECCLHQRRFRYR